MNNFNKEITTIQELTIIDSFSSSTFTYGCWRAPILFSCGTHSTTFPTFGFLFHRIFRLLFSSFYNFIRRELCVCPNLVCCLAEFYFWGGERPWTHAISNLFNSVNKFSSLFSSLNTFKHNLSVLILTHFILLTHINSKFT